MGVMVDVTAIFKNESVSKAVLYYKYFDTYVNSKDYDEDTAITKLLINTQKGRVIGEIEYDLTDEIQFKEAGIKVYITAPPMICNDTAKEFYKKWYEQPVSLADIDSSVYKEVEGLDGEIENIIAKLDVCEHKIDLNYIDLFMLDEFALTQK